MFICLHIALWWQSWVASRETVLSTKPKIFTIWLFKKKFAGSRCKKLGLHFNMCHWRLLQLFLISAPTGIFFVGPLVSLFDPLWFWKTTFSFFVLGSLLFPSFTKDKLCILPHPAWPRPIRVSPTRGKGQEKHGPWTTQLRNSASPLGCG